jgi:hypothetical protein
MGSARNNGESGKTKQESYYIITLIFVALVVALGAAYGVLTAASSDSDSSASSTLNIEDYDADYIDIQETVTLSGTANVLLIVLDDAGWGDFSYHSDDPWYSLHTPNMDTIMSEGIYYSNYYTQTICTPARSSLMTGRWTWVLGIQSEILFMTCMDAHLDKSFPTYAELTHEKNYTNYLYGKWHLGMDSWSSTPLGRGFDEFLGCFNSGGVTGGGGSIEERGGWYSVYNPQAWNCNSDLADREIETRTYTECLMRNWEYYYAYWNKSTKLCYTWLEESLSTACTNYTKASELTWSDSALYPEGYYIHLSI